MNDQPRAMAFGAFATPPARIGGARSTAPPGTTTGDKVDGAIASILVLDGGEVREVGTHEELLRKPGGIYSRLYELQFSEEPAL